MALPAKPLEEVQAMSEARRTDYFETYGRYLALSPKKRYAIRVGSRSLFSADVRDLRQQFDKLLRYSRTEKEG